MKKIIFISLLLPFSAFAAEIDGAFGLKFNSYKEAKPDKYKSINFTPEKGFKFAAFNKYSYSVTPKTNKIYSISAEGNSTTTCEKDIGIINKLIENKYNTVLKRIEIPIKYEKKNDVVIIYSLNTDKNRIILSCDPQYKSIAISYTDINIAKLSQEENAVMVKKHINKEVNILKENKENKTRGL